MRVQTLYAVAGLVCGLVLGPYIGLAAARMMGKVAWLYEFQNGVWVNWAVIPFGAIFGLTLVFFCYQLGAAAGRHYDTAAAKRLRHVKAVPWAVIIVGIGVGAITVRTIGDEQRALVHYIQARKDATARLLTLAAALHRITTYGIEWPGGGEAGRIDLSFRGRRQGDYRVEWKILSQQWKEPLLSGSRSVGLGTKPRSTNIRVDPSDLANAYIERINRPETDVSVDGSFRLVLELRPILSGREWAALPEDEAVRLDGGESILFDRVTTTFQARFESRDGRMIW